MKIVLVSGGTGGHFFPAVGLYETIQSHRKHYETLFITSHQQDRYKHLLPPKSYFVKAMGFPRRNPLAILIFLVYLIKNTVGALSIFFKENPTVVIGFGGYISAGPILAAILLRIPYMIHEQNSVPGKANKLFARKAVKILTTLKLSENCLPARLYTKIIQCGIPLRRDVLPPYNRTGDSANRSLFTVLIIGGSQGARIFNRWIKDVLDQLDEIRDTVSFIHLCGQIDIDALEQVYAQHKVSHQCHVFYEKMGDIYARCSMALCRAGASTLYELSAWEIPAVIVPYPYAADNHQMANAKSMEYPDWYTVIEQKTCTPYMIARCIKNLFKKHKKGNLKKPDAVKVFPQDAGEHIIGIIENEMGIV